MTDLLDELDFYRREVLTAQQQFFTYLALHRVPFEEPDVFKALNQEPLLWMTMRESALQGFFTSVGRVFDEGSAHNVNALLKVVGGNLGEFARSAQRDRRVQDGSSEEAANAYALDKHELAAADLRGLRREVAELRQVWKTKYRDIRHKVYAHSEVTETEDLFANTNIDELVAMLDSLPRRRPRR